MSARPTALVLRTAGTNCDAELCRAFERAGAATELVHVRALIGRPERVGRAALIGFPGGFSHGDDLGAGRVLATTLRERLWPALRDAVARGVPMIGVCNGFQVLVQLGLLPGAAPGETLPDRAPTPSLALAPNASGRFVDRWCRVRADVVSPCVWTAPFARLTPDDPGASLPVAHGEGRLIASSDMLLDALDSRAQLALRYASDDNPNGSSRDVAGVCDASGLVFGLMPHPERSLDARMHPMRGVDDPTPGLAMFRAAVEHAIGAGV